VRSDAQGRARNGHDSASLGVQHADLFVITDDPFYSPNYKPAARRQPQPGELLFEFIPARNAVFHEELFMEQRLITCDHCGTTTTLKVNTTSLPDGWWHLNGGTLVLAEIHQRRQTDVAGGLSFCSLKCVGDFAQAHDLPHRA
jgi:hypothetical protein